MDAVGPEVEVALGRQIALLPARVLLAPRLLEAGDGRCRETGRVRADKRCQRFLEIAGRDALQVEDRDQHFQALRPPRVPRQDRWRIPDALALGSFAVAHPRLANADRADPGHDLTLREMAVAHNALLAGRGLQIGVLCKKLGNLRFDSLAQQRTRAVTQGFRQGIAEGPWLGELDHVTVGHSVSLLHWRSGGVEHHHDTPPYPVTPSPTSRHSSSFQSRIAQRHAWRLLLASHSALLTSHRCSLRRARSRPLPGCNCFSLESCQNTFGHFQLIELSTQFFSFGIEPLKPLGNPLLLLSHQRRHLLSSPGSQVRPAIRTAAVFCDDRKISQPKNTRVARIATQTDF